jgi:hypothetical protein
MFMNGLHLELMTKEGTFVSVPASSNSENIETINRRVVQQIIIDLVKFMAYLIFKPESYHDRFNRFLVGKFE